MNKYNPLLFVSAALVVALSIAFVGAGASLADKGGCPNSNSGTGASRADDNSAHGPDKQSERECDSSPTDPTPTPTLGGEPLTTPTSTATPAPPPADTPTATPTAAAATPTDTPSPTPSPTESPTPTATPSPEPTPTPTPAPGADIEVVSLTVIAPATATVGLPFQVTGAAELRNNGPVAPAVVDTTFTPSLPAGCSATTGVIIVQNTTLVGSFISSLSRSWMVTCVQAGAQPINMNATTMLDPLQPAVDPNMANNTSDSGGVIQVN
jgi:outer membrane biosynthesis protein TonB